MQTFALHCVVAPHLTPELVQQKIGSDEPVPVSRSVKPRTPSRRFQVRLNPALDPPKFYLFEITVTNGEVIRDMGTILGIERGAAVPAVHILDLCAQKLGFGQFVVSE